MSECNHNEAIPNPPMVEPDPEREILARVEATLRQQNDYHTALHETALNIMNRLDVNDLLQAIIERAAALIGTEHGYIYLLDEDRTRMTVRIVTGTLFQNSLNHIIERGEGVAGRIWQSGMPLTEDDYSSWQGSSRRYGFYSTLHAIVGVPLKSGNEVVGVLGLIYEEAGRHFTNEEIVLLGQFAELASIALDNARLYTAVQQELVERKQADEALRASEQRYRALFELTSDGVSIFDLQGNIIMVNQQFADLLGYTVAAMNELSIFQWISPAEKQDSSARITALLAGVKLPPYERTLLSKDGREVQAELSVVLVRDEAGNPSHLQSVVRDITARKRAERRLAAQHTVTRVLAEANSLAEASPLFLEAICQNLGWPLGALWLVDHTAAVLRCQHVWSQPALEAAAFEEVCRSCTFEQGVGIPGLAWATRQPLWVPNITTDPRFPRAAIANAVGLHSAFAIPLYLGNEALGVIEFLSSLVQQPDEELLQMFTAIGSQIGQFAERKQTEGQLHLLSSAVRSSSEAIVITGAQPAGEQGVLILYANDAYYRITGHTPDEIVGKPTSVLRSVNVNADVERNIGAAMMSQKSVKFDTLNHKKDGTPFWAEFTFEPIKDETGKPIHWVAVMRDVTEHRQYEQQLLYLSTHDYLTDLPNRRALEERLAQVVARIHSSEESALMFIDLDNFKEINDTTPLGHDAGDQALRFVTHLLNRRLRDDDMLARIGGDEFAVLLDRTTMKRAEQIANRLSAAVAKEPFTIAGHQFTISLSVGLVAISGQQSARTVLFQADTAMYIAKKQGGNRVIVYKSAD